MSDIGEVVHLSDLVADLKARVEALERELAALKTPLIVTEPAPPIDWSVRWDSGRWSEEDFRG